MLLSCTDLDQLRVWPMVLFHPSLSAIEQVFLQLIIINKFDYLVDITISFS